MYALINIDKGLVKDYDNDNDYNVNGGGIDNDDGHNL